MKYLLLIVALLVFIAACSEEVQLPPPPVVETSEPVVLGAPGKSTNTKRSTIEIIGEGFDPKMSTISVGETVVFVNKDSGEHWPAVDPHPVHDSYPDKGGCIDSAFDACNALKKGESFSFTFDHAGKWNYHDHLHPRLKGTVVVQ